MRMAQQAVLDVKRCLASHKYSPLMLTRENESKIVSVALRPFSIEDIWSNLMSHVSSDVLR